MKTLTLILFAFLLTHLSYAQNTFPNTGSVGIGTLSPAYNLDVAGTIRATSNIITPTVNSLYFGYGAGSNPSSLAIGTNVLNGSNTGLANLAIGANALSSNTTGNQNLGIGANVLHSNTTGIFNVAVGNLALRNNVSGGSSVAIGHSALMNSLGGSNVGVGSFAGLSVTTGTNNSFLGFGAGYSVTTGINNIIIGSSPATSNLGLTTGSNNTIIGSNVTGLAPDLANHIILSDGSGNQRLVIDQNGYTGIGTTLPNERLEVVGAVVLGGPTANLDGSDLSFEGNKSSRLVIGTNRTGYEGEFDFIANKGAGNNGGFAFYQHDEDGTERELIKFKGTGYVGIGMTNPDEKLSVNGTVHAKEIRVDLTGWPDYVFKPEYHRAKLSDVKNYLEQNHHLPEMPSAEQVAKDGIKLGEMNARLLRKIEELTLYLIEKDKEISKEKLKNELQQHQLDRINKKLKLN